MGCKQISAIHFLCDIVIINVCQFFSILINESTFYFENCKVLLSENLHVKEKEINDEDVGVILLA